MRATDSLTPDHLSSLDQFAEIAVDTGRSEEEFVRKFMELRQPEAREAYRIAAYAARIWKNFCQKERERIDARYQAEMEYRANHS